MNNNSRQGSPLKKYVKEFVLQACKELQAGCLNLNKNELLQINFQGFFPDFKNTNFSAHRLNDYFCASAVALYFDSNILVQPAMQNPLD